MIDVMLFGVLQMPYEMAMNDEMSRFQFYQKAQQAADRIAELEEKCKEYEKFIAENTLKEKQMNYLGGGGSPTPCHCHSCTTARARLLPSNFMLGGGAGVVGGG